MKTPILLATLFLCASATHALADAELRLYEGDHEWDLKDRLMVISQDGRTFDYQYMKKCDAYNGCKAIQTNTSEDAKLASLSAQDLNGLNAAIGNLASQETPVAATPAKQALCKQFRRLVYEVKNSAGKVSQTETIRSCTGTRLPDPNASTIERILNRVSDFAGL